MTVVGQTAVDAGNSGPHKACPKPPSNVKDFCISHEEEIQQ